MAIEKKLIHFGKLADFEAQLTAGNILDRSIVFIQDAKKIWTHGTYYDCSEGTAAADIVQSDWNENDPVSDSYIQGRTHYSYDVEQIALFSIASKNEGDILVTGLYVGGFYKLYNQAGGKSQDFHFVEGRKVPIPSVGPPIEAVCTYEDDYCLKLTTPTYGMNESFSLMEMYVEQLKDIYVPETIARTSELKTINGESIYGGGDITIEGESLTESDIAAMGFTKNTGTYSKPSGGIPKSDLASAVQTSLGKADTALQSYTEQYKGTITGVSANGTSVATSGVANIPAASTSAYGVTKLSSATNSTSTTLAATASAVKAAYDLANSYKGTVTGVKVNGTTKSPTSGTVDIGNVVTSVKINGSTKTPTNGVVDLGTISGGGGSSSGGNGAYSEVNHGTSDTTFTLTPNTFHVWDEVANLTLTLGSETVGVANEFLFQFTSGAAATSLTLPDDIKWANDAAPTIAENMIYQVSILKGMASVLEFNNAVVKRKNYIYGETGSYLIKSDFPVASDVTIEYWDNFGDDIYTVVMLAGTSEVATSERFGYIENVSPKEDDQFYYLHY